MSPSAKVGLPTSVLQSPETADVTLGDTTIPANSSVFVVLGAAHRDPERFFMDRSEVVAGMQALARQWVQNR